MMNVGLISILLGTFLTTSFLTLLNYNKKSTDVKKTAEFPFCGNDREFRDLRKTACGVPTDPSTGHPSLITLYGIGKFLIALGRYKPDCSPTNGTLWYPSNITELEEYCSSINSYGKCLIKLEDVCDGENVAYLGASLDACAEGTDFHKGVKENLECISRSWSNLRDGTVPCRSIDQNIADEYVREYVQNNVFPYEAGIDERMYSLLVSGFANNIYHNLVMFGELGCFLSHLDCPTADITAEDAVLEIHARVHSYLHLKISEAKNHTIAILEGLPVGDEQKTWIRDGIKKYEDKCEQINCFEYETETIPKLYID